MKPKNRKTVGDYALEVLQQNQRAMHIKEMIPLMVKAGWECKSRNLRQVAYTSLHGLIGRGGEECPFVLLGNGYWATREIAASQEIEVPTERVKKATLVLFSTIPEDKRRCRNCTHIEYDDVQVVSRREGGCSNYLNSKRTGVLSSAPACPFWQERGPDQKMKDQSEGKNSKLIALKHGCLPHQQRLRDRDAYIR